MTDIGCYIDGRFRPGAGTPFPDFDPATGEAHARVSPADHGDVVDAIAAARRAAADWRRVPADMRAAWLTAIADALEEEAEEFSAMETRDTGLLLSLTSQGHVPRAVQCFRHFAAAVGEGEQTYPLGDAYLTLVRREPLGVVGIIAPWNAPLAVAAMNAAAALALGNCVILKPSERSPLTSEKLAEIVHALDLPAGVFQVVQGSAEIGRHLASADGIDGLCFVGGVEAGREVMANGARTLKRLTLELGGKSPTVVFADCDFQAAVDGALLSAFASNGEVCASGSRILVERSLYPSFLEALSARASAIRLGDPMSADSEMGPLIDRFHRSRVDAMVRAALAQGARATTPVGVPRGLDRGAYYRPVVLDRVDPAMVIAQEEVFGPVVVVMPFDDDEQAIALANGTVYGLHASVWSADLARAMRVASGIEAGSVAVNAGMVRDIRAPFGGRKQSGIGRIGGRWSLDAFSEPKSIAVSLNPYPLPRMGAMSHVDTDQYPDP